MRWGAVGHPVETPFAYPELTVRENLRAAALLHGVAPREVAAAVGAIVGRLQLQDHLDRRAEVV